MAKPPILVQPSSEHRSHQAERSPSWWEQGWLIALIGLFPTHWFVQLSDLHAYVQGLCVDYLILKVFVSQVLIWLVLLGWAWRTRSTWLGKNRWSIWQKLWGNNWMAGVCVLSLAGAQFFSQRPVVGLAQLATLSTAGGLAVYLWHHRRWITTQRWIVVVAIALLFHSLVALAQWWLQTSVFPSYWWFGEPRLMGQPGLATSTWWGRELLLPYGVTAHPNVLAGSFVFYLVILFRNQINPFREMVSHEKISEKFSAVWPVLKWGSILLGLAALGLTQSITAFLGVSAGLTWFLFSHTDMFKKIVSRLHHTQILLITAVTVMSLLIAAPVVMRAAAEHFPESQSFVRREWLSDASWKMWQTYPWLGVGLQQFTVHVEQFSSNTEVVRFVQPVHHVGSLWLAETGIIGTGLLLGISFLTIRQILKKYPITHPQHKIHLARNLGSDGKHKHGERQSSFGSQAGGETGDFFDFLFGAA